MSVHLGTEDYVAANLNPGYLLGGEGQCVMLLL